MLKKVNPAVSTILVVDDEPNIQTMIAMILKSSGYDVLQASDGKEAIEMAQAHVPDLVLMDVWMPEMDGITVCRQLRTGELTKNVPVIIMTAYAPSTSRTDALLAGATDYISKPFKKDELLQRVRAVLQQGSQFVDQQDRPLQELVHTALAIVPCEFAWLLTIDNQRQTLESRALAVDAKTGKSNSDRYLAGIIGNKFPLGRTQSTMTTTVISGIAALNLSREYISPDGDKTLHEVTGLLGISYISMLPLQVTGITLGLLILGTIALSQEDEKRTHQVLTTLASHAATIAYNAKLYSALMQRAEQLETAYSDLQHAEQLTNEWVQNVSHELRTPLTSIIGYSDLLRNGDLGIVSEEQQLGLSIINDKARQLTSIVNNLLAFQHSEQDINLSAASIVEIAQAAIKSSQAFASKKGITLSLEVVRKPPNIDIDVRQILQVFDNLLDNAVKFSPQGSVVTISVEESATGIRVAIKDEGIGIPETEHAKIWWRFYQVDGSATRKYEGLGIGLALAKQNIENHHGRIWVTSEPGKGSVFTFVIPRDHKNQISLLGKGI